MSFARSREPADSGSDDGDPHMAIVPRPCAAGDRLIRSLEVFGAGLGEAVAGDPALLAEADGRLLDAPPDSRRAAPLLAELLAPTGILGEIVGGEPDPVLRDRKSTRLNSSHVAISYAVFCLKKRNNITRQTVRQ